MAAAMAHRGPDGEGFLFNDPRAPALALGMRRLSIIDLPGGHQPIWNELRDVAVIFNGELYNYRELRERLTHLGHRFTTQSDTEILVHAWEEWGDDCLAELRGMFAFAIADFGKHHASGPVLLYTPDRRRLPRPHPWRDPRRSPAAKDVRRPRTFAAAAKAVRPLLEDSIRAHLIADVPVGLFLSSGLDSGAIAALASREHQGIQSFTLSFNGTAYDESALTRVVAKRCGTQHAEIPLSGDEIPARLDEALAALDQPTMDGINTYFVSWAARQVGLKVALAGLGGDELFAGYSTFADTPKLARLTGVAQFVPSTLRDAASGVLRSLFASGRSPDAARKALAAWRNPQRLPHPYFFSRALFPPGEIDKLIDPRFRPSALASDGYTLEPTWLGWP